MDAALQAIADKIQEYIRDKAIETPDPAKVGASDLAEIQDDFVTIINGLQSAVIPVPSGVEWVVVPGDPVFGTGTITETASEIRVDGANYPIASDTLAQPYAATGKHRLDYIAVNYDAAAHPELPAAFYVVIQGAEVLTSESVAAPTLPINHLFVREVLVTDNAAAPRPRTSVNAVSIDGGTPALPDPSGLVNLDFSGYDDRISDLETFAVTAADDINNKANKKLTINTYTASHTLTGADETGKVRMNVATANVVTVPLSTFEVGAQIIGQQVGAGQTMISPAGGVTILSAGNRYKVAEQYGQWTLIQDEPNVWSLSGNLTT